MHIRDLIENANIFSILGKGDLAIIQEMQNFINAGLPTGVDKEPHAWLSLNSEIQNKISDFMSRITLVTNMKKLELMKRRIELIKNNMIEIKKYSSEKEKEAQLIAQDDVYADIVESIHTLESLLQFIDSNLWNLRNSFNKIPW